MFRAVAFKFQTHTFYRQTHSLWLKHCHWKARKLPQDDSLQAKFQLKDLNLGNSRKNWIRDFANISLSAEVCNYFGTCSLCLYRFANTQNFLHTSGKGSLGLFLTQRIYSTRSTKKIRETKTQRHYVHATLKCLYRLLTSLETKIYSVCKILLCEQQ